jgi:hypothetical protein
MSQPRNRAIDTSEALSDRQKFWLILAAVVIGLGVVIFGLSRLIPVVTDVHTTAVVEHQSNCVNHGDSGVSCDMLVSFYAGSRHIQAVIPGANPGEVSTDSSGEKTLEIYYQAADPHHPHEQADDEINDVLIVIGGLAVVTIAVVCAVKSRRRTAA